MHNNIPEGIQELQASVRSNMEQLFQETEADFLSLALYDPEQREIRWRVAYGALSDRYKAIAIRVGKGIAGDVISSKRPLLIRSFPDDIASEPLEYPIMIIEKLVSCYASPVGDEKGVFGALMAGDRMGRIFTKTDKEAIDRIARKIGKRYAPSYEASDLRDERMQAVKSPLMIYLKRHLSSPPAFAGAEILDQRITRISDNIQVEITKWLDRLLEMLERDTAERMMICVERNEGSWMTLDVKVSTRLHEPGQRLDWLIDRVGRIRGNVEMYNEPDQFRLRINLPVGLLTEDTPWIF